jgi:hypothetical protein
VNEYKITTGWEFFMDMSRRLGILIFCAVPAIIGGGIMFHFFDSYMPVAVYEICLILAALGVANK